MCNRGLCNLLGYYNKNEIEKLNLKNLLPFFIAKDH